MEDLKIDRDEKVCLDSMFKLKAVASARGEHKQRIQLNLTLTGVKVYDDASKVGDEPCARSWSQATPRLDATRLS